MPTVKQLLAHRLSLGEGFANGYDLTADIRQHYMTQAADPSTSPARLTELFGYQLTFYSSLGDRQEFLRTLASNPNAPAALLLKLAPYAPEAVGYNSAVQLLSLEDPLFLGRLILHAGSRGRAAILTGLKSQGVELKARIEAAEVALDKLLAETPIDSFTTVGDWERNISFKDVDRRILTSPKAVEKIKATWNKTPYHFDMYFVNDPKTNPKMFREVGEVSLDFIQRYFPIRTNPVTQPDMFQADPFVFKPNPNAITVFYTNNAGTERVMMTGWVMAHRLGHAFNADKGTRGGSVARAWNTFTNELYRLFKNMMSEVYGQSTRITSPYGASSLDITGVLKFAAQTLGTMKAAREGNLRNWYEFGYELLAQYLLTGKITLNRLPDRMPIGAGSFGRKAYTSGTSDPEVRADRAAAKETYNEHDLDYYAKELEGYLDTVLDIAVGKIFVM